MLKEIELSCSNDRHSEFSLIKYDIVTYEVTYKSNPQLVQKLSSILPI